MWRDVKRLRCSKFGVKPLLLLYSFRVWCRTLGRQPMNANLVGMHRVFSHKGYVSARLQISGLGLSSHDKESKGFMVLQYHHIINLIVPEEETFWMSLLYITEIMTARYFMDLPREHKLVSCLREALEGPVKANANISIEECDGKWPGSSMFEDAGSGGSKHNRFKWATVSLSQLQWLRYWYFKSFKPTNRCRLKVHSRLAREISHWGALAKKAFWVSLFFWHVQSIIIMHIIDRIIEYSNTFYDYHWSYIWINWSTHHRHRRFERTGKK